MPLTPTSTNDGIVLTEVATAIATAQGRLGQFVGANGIRPQWDICTPLSSQEGSMPLTPTSTNDGIVLTDLSVAIPKSCGMVYFASKLDFESLSDVLFAKNKEDWRQLELVKTVYS
jgi:hypothetical protein